MLQIELNHSEIIVGLICLSCFFLSTFVVGKWWSKFRSSEWILVMFWVHLAAWAILCDGERLKETAVIIAISCAAAISILYVMASTYERLKINIGNNISLEADNKNVPISKYANVPIENRRSEGEAMAQSDKS